MNRSKCSMHTDFEGQSLLFICWDTTFAPLLFQRIYEHVLSDEAQLVLVCKSVNEQQVITDYLRRHMLPLKEVRFMVFEFDSIWIRDCFPIVKRIGTDKSLVAFGFSKKGARKKDAVLAKQVAQLFGLPLEKSDVTLSGGNITYNGKGVAICTDEIWRENKLGKEELKRRFLSDFGVERLVVVQKLPHEHTGHIDMMAKFINSETLLVASLNEIMDDYIIMEKNIKEINEKLPWVKIVRMPIAPGSGSYENLGNVFYSYVNSVILISHILVPLYGEKTDEAAVEIYQNEFPNRKVKGVYCKDIAQMKGALHCMTAQL